MGHPAEKARRRATYADVEAAPPNMVAELIDGELHLMPRPTFRHANVQNGIVEELRGPFQRGRGGPGGWWIWTEPELHFPDPAEPGEIEALVPDVAGWRLERLPEFPESASLSLAPDWVCEVLSKSREKYDREVKMPIYAREGVPHAWLIDPVEQTLEVHLLGSRRRWKKVAVHRGDVRVRIAPFDAVEIDLSGLRPPKGRTS